MENEFIATFLADTGDGLKKCSFKVIPLEKKDLYHSLVEKIQRIPTEDELNELLNN